ncbi:response regulator transcription factor [Yersinia sp. 1652 StPb PI]|uniref:helix-turn-helix transcriptional regulator n=1 Tax=Yersinia sp. 1652 StPb PI TaxID=3061649 RepID=UPI00355BAB79
MEEIILFSHHDLFRFYLKQLVESFLISNAREETIKVSICYDLNELEKNLQESDGVIAIIDIDNVSKFEQFRLYHLINLRKNRTFLFTKEEEYSHNYTDLMLGVSSFLLSKSASLSHIEKIVHDFIFNYDFFMEGSNGLKKEKKSILTSREQEVCGLILSGMSNSEIAKKLSISNKTVSIHRRNIYAKYQTDSLIKLYLKLK